MLENIEKNKDLFIRSLMRERNCSREQADIMVTALARLEINKNYFIRFLIKAHKSSSEEAELMFSELKIKTIQALDRGTLTYKENTFNAWSRETMKHAFFDYIRKLRSREDTKKGRLKYFILSLGVKKENDAIKFINEEQEYNFSYENIMTIEQCIKRLPDRLRKIINLKKKGISTQSEISKAMKIKEGTIAGLCIEAMQRFKNCLNGSLEVTY